MPPALEELFPFLRFPSISTDFRHAGDVRNCDGWLPAKLSATVLDASLHETLEQPRVIARNTHVPGRRTLLKYGHQDVQTVDPLHLWTGDPFQPEIRADTIRARQAGIRLNQELLHEIAKD